MFKSKLIFTALALCCSSVYAQSYNARALPQGVYPNAINNSGYVAGFTRPVGIDRAVLVRPDGHVETVSPDESGHSNNYGINHGSLMAGFTRRSVGSSTYDEATLFRSGGSPIRIGHLPSTTSSVVYKVNDVGWAVGQSGGLSRAASFVWVPNYGTLESGTMHELQCPDSMSGEKTNLVAYSIAPTQPLIGGACDGGGYPVLWWYGQTYDMRALVPDFERRRSEAASAGGYFSCGIKDIATNLNFVISCSFNREGTRPRRLSVAYNWATGASVRVENAELVAINSQGCAVGTINPDSRLDDGIAVKACTDGSVTNISPSSVVSGGVRPHQASDINDSGQILIYGLDANFYARGFVLTPR